MSDEYSFEQALAGREDLLKYTDNRLLLFALEMYRGIEDIHSVAVDSLTDGKGDKKCDLVFIDREQGYVIIAQGYYCSNNAKKEAPANKASDLNTAVAWLFSKDYDKLPITLKAAAMELDDALSKGEISVIELWYVHNVPESSNVKDELGKVELSASALLKRHYKEDVETVTAKEIGKNTLETWYRGTQAPILVTESATFDTTGGYYTKGDNWAAYSTAIPAKWLQTMYDKHGRDLFCANVRDYLGSRRSDKNINYNMKLTAQNHPERFWVYNNGITALVNDFAHDADGNSGMLEIQGIAIVNGAQTTGALGSVKNAELVNAFVPVRFVKCSDQETIQKIIHYNNSQNKLEAADFRSNDPIQSRLRREFEDIPDVAYQGGRRGGDIDKISRKRDIIPSYTAGQALAAFHQKPAVAYNEKSNIWQSDSLYSSIFPSQITAHHLLFAFSLLRCIEQNKMKLRCIPDSEQTASQREQINYFELRGASFLLVSAVAASIEVLFGRAVPDHFALRWKGKISLKEAIDNWSQVINCILPFANNLGKAISESRLQNKETVKNQISIFRSLIEATKNTNEPVFREFSQKIETVK